MLKPGQPAMTVLLGALIAIAPDRKSVV